MASHSVQLINTSSTSYTFSLVLYHNVLDHSQAEAVLEPSSSIINSQNSNPNVKTARVIRLRLFQTTALSPSPNDLTGARPCKSLIAPTASTSLLPIPAHHVPSPHLPAGRRRLATILAVS